jgi:hypothetical protein
MNKEMQVQTIGHEMETPSEPQCRHHWLIEPPAGPTSKGRCKRCGEERYFINSTADWLPDGGSAKESLSGLVRGRAPVDDWQENA